MVTFARINLLDETWPDCAPFDCIFCRNVVIYFDGPTKQQLVNRLASALRADGLLVLGHSEGLLGRTSRLRSLGKTMYQSDAVGGGP